MRRPPWWALSAWLLLVATEQVQAADDGVVEWPQRFEFSNGVAIMYQPQPEAFHGNRLEGRAAVVVELLDQEPAFGAVWIEADVNADRDERLATITSIRITRVRFPDRNAEQEQKLKDLIEREMAGASLQISLERLLASLALVEKARAEALRLSVAPPDILVVTEPAVLITIDGEPSLRPETDTSLLRVVNSAYSILYDPGTREYFLSADEGVWYSARDITGDWSIVVDVPDEVAASAPAASAKDDSQETEDANDTPQGPAPRLLVRTEPAELISIDGAPEYAPVGDADLLYVTNTESDLLLHAASREYFVLLAGRWYASAALQGPWRHVPGTELPPEFSNIPEDSEMGGVLYAVPGTLVADEAVLDAQIPQTAAVDRGKAALRVDYDGTPRFVAIEGTGMAYAANTATQVVLVNGVYFAVDDAVWFRAERAAGPWVLATSVPDLIYTIPPQSPVYNITHVYIYNVTPTIVYVGYTPGYTHTYVYGGTVVYGTGYYYPGWYGRYYYPRPSSWGYHVRYTSWGGWSFGLSYSSGPYPFLIGYGGWYRGGWWGPSRYRSYRRGYRHGVRRGYRSAQRRTSRNVYKTQKNVARTSPVRASSRTSRAATSRPNNVYSDRNGGVHRRTNSGWQQRSGNTWRSSPSTSRSSPQTSTRGQLNSSHQMRQRGTTRSRRR